MPFTIERMNLHVGSSVQPSKPKREKAKQKLMAWANTCSSSVFHSKQLSSLVADCLPSDCWVGGSIPG